MNILSNIKFIRRLLAAIFISFFLYLSFSLGNNYVLISRIWVVTLSILTLFVIAKSKSNKENLKNLFSLTTLFFIVLSATQTIKNIYAPHGLPILLYEIIHYILTIFVLSYNVKEKRFLDTGLVLFIVYSFRIFDLRLADNEFVLIHALTLILALIWFEESYIKREILLTRANSIFAPLIILIIVVIFSTINTACPHNSLAQATIMINFIFIAFLMANYIKDIRQVNLFIFILFLIGGILVILVMNEVLYKFATRITSWYVGNEKLITLRRIRYTLPIILSRIWIGGIETNYPTIHANSIAGYFAAFLCLITSSLPSYKSSIIKRWAKLFISIMLFVLVSTYSRLGIFSFIFAISILIMLRYKKFINFVRRKILYLSLSLTFIMVLIVLSPIKENIILRLHQTHSSNSTFYSCKITLVAIQDNHLLGAGFENYYLLSKYTKEPIATAESTIAVIRNLTRSAPHSLYLGIAFGLGIIGLLVFIWLLIDVIVYCLKLNNYIHDDGYEKYLLQGIFVAFMSLIVHGILSMTFHLTVLPAFFWVFIGLVVSIGNIKDYNKKIKYKLKLWQIRVFLIAIILISIGIVINPLLAERYYNLALNNFNSGHLNEAIREIYLAKKFMPINPKFYELTAEIQIKQRLTDEAFESYKKALHFKQGFAFYHTRLGQLYQEKKMYPDALIEFNKAIMLDKYGAYLKEHYSDLGFLYEVMGRREEAIAQFKKAILIDPGVVKNSAWEGLKYLDEILSQIYQDYKIEKDKNPLVAKQILYFLMQVYEYRKEIDRPKELNFALF